MKIIQLQYPDEASLSKILDDLTVLSRNTGQKGLRAKAAFDTADPALDGLSTKLTQRGVPQAAPVPNGLASTQAVVQAGTPIAITGGEVTFTVVNSEITGGAFDPD